MKYDDAIPIMCNNTSFINISKNLVIHSRTKHISTWYHFLREKVVEKEFKLKYASTMEHIVDIFTKDPMKEIIEYI